MLDVVFISNYWHFENEKSSSRYHSVASLSSLSGMKVEVVTSDFYHTKKQYRNLETVNRLNAPYEITLLHESGYKTNVSFGRIKSHSEFAKNVIKYLKARNKPDVIYLFVPPVELSEKVVRYARANDIRVIIDIQDAWPEAFSMLMPSFVTKTLLFPMRRSADKTYSGADEIVAVSQTYVNRALSVNKRVAKGHSVFIGTDLSVFDTYARGAVALEGQLRPITMAYIGMLGHSYDLIGTMDAMRVRIEAGRDDVELLIMGDGPLYNKFSEYAKHHKLPVRFTGRLPYEEMVKKLVSSHIAINPIVQKSASSIINKHADYVSAGLPVINIQEVAEFGELLEEYQAGINCQVGDVRSLATAIDLLASDQNLRKKMGNNSRKLAEELFDRNKTYQRLIDVIKGDKYDS